MVGYTDCMMQNLLQNVRTNNEFLKKIETLSFDK